MGNIANSQNLRIMAPSGLNLYCEFHHPYGEPIVFKLEEEKPMIKKGDKINEPK